MRNQTPRCRFCNAQLHFTFLDLGQSPLANKNLSTNQVASEKQYPLIVRVCDSCLLVQADGSVPPEDIFCDYDYFSSYSRSWVAHTNRYCEEMKSRFKLGERSFVVEIASNDGCLLKHFVGMGIPVQGIEPAANVAEVARKAGVPTEVAFFGVKTAKRIASQGRKADLMVANNVLAHVPTTKDFMGGFVELLAPEGVATFEFPHLMQLIELVQFDTIYHEHFFYLSLVVVEKIAASVGLRVFDVEELPTHGGSLRLFVCHRSASHQQTLRLLDLRARESGHMLDRLDGYKGFATKVQVVKDGFRTFIEKAKAEGKTIAGYGAAAKGNTFLNFCGVSYPTISAIYDLNLVKQNKLTPGTHIPILPPQEIDQLRPDYVLILPWNLADEVRFSMARIGAWGGRFVTAVPEIRIY